MSGKELFIRFTASVFRKLLLIYVFSYFPFSFEGRMWDLIVSVPDHCLSFYFLFGINYLLFNSPLVGLYYVVFWSTLCLGTILWYCKISDIIEFRSHVYYSCH